MTLLCHMNIPYKYTHMAFPLESSYRILDIAVYHLSWPFPPAVRAIVHTIFLDIDPTAFAIWANQFKYHLEDLKSQRAGPLVRVST